MQTVTTDAEEKRYAAIGGTAAGGDQDGIGHGRHIRLESKGEGDRQHP